MADSLGWIIIGVIILLVVSQIPFIPCEGINDLLAKQLAEKSFEGLGCLNAGVRVVRDTTLVDGVYTVVACNDNYPCDRTEFREGYEGDDFIINAEKREVCISFKVNKSSEDFLRNDNGEINISSCSCKENLLKIIRDIKRIEYNGISVIFEETRAL